MRLKITKPISGTVDGVPLNRFVTGFTYDVGTVIANYLLAEGAAVPVRDEIPALVLPIDHVSDITFQGTRRAEAADHLRRRVRRKKR